ncbi:hypothetical protein [Pseudomonas sp. GW101-3H06]|uniref:hypothetical protein n=1 Tax=Pseudomonas sp. GW101-3H06 TaxID=2751347 RepID=UPI001A91B9DD|nr:hypothetical protein [Pseudomonas sp. GW101-3H06]
MSIFDKGVDPEEFKMYKVEIESRIKQLSDAIKIKTSDSEASAAESASNALNSLNSIKTVQTTIEQNLKDILECKKAAEDEIVAIENLAKNSKELNKNISDLFLSSEKTSTAVTQQQTTLSEVAAEMTNDLTTIRTALLEAQKLPEQIESSKKQLDGITAINKDIDGLLIHSMKRKSDIDELHKTILGAEVKGADGTIERVDGLIDELQNAYTSIKDQTEDMEAQVNNTVKDLIGKHEVNLSTEKEKFEKLLDTSNKRYSAINDEISGLLPGAMAAGLSAAYEQKKDDEIISFAAHEFSFKLAIGLMVAVSLIPFGVDVFLLGWKGNDLVEVIKGTPNLIISILPLYFPVLWFAYSSSKKLNLSKRLIEEYTHKAVLGRTFSGLSNQIESLPRESVVRDELRTRLLFNMLQVSSENPGKLITDYNKTDHPLMDALENSAKLSDSMESLAKLPGFSTLAKKLAARTDELLSSQAKKVEDGLAAQEKMETPSEQNGAESAKPMV